MRALRLLWLVVGAGLVARCCVDFDPTWAWIGLVIVVGPAAIGGRVL